MAQSRFPAGPSMHLAGCLLDARPAAVIVHPPAKQRVLALARKQLGLEPGGAGLPLDGDVYDQLIVRQVPNQPQIISSRDTGLRRPPGRGKWRRAETTGKMNCRRQDERRLRYVGSEAAVLIQNPGPINADGNILYSERLIAVHLPGKAEP